MVWSNQLSKNKLDKFDKKLFCFLITQLGQVILGHAILEWPLRVGYFRGRHFKVIFLGGAILELPFWGRHFRMVILRTSFWNGHLGDVILDWPFWCIADALREQ